MTWVCSGSSQAKLITTDGAESTEGEIVAPDTDNQPDRTRALVERICALSPDMLLCHARGDSVDCNAIRYMPDSIPRVLILHGSTMAVYRAAKAVRDYVNATVAISPRIDHDLMSAYGFRKERVRLIPIGINTQQYSSFGFANRLDGPLRILSHGRIEKHKGVFWLPEILAKLSRRSSAWTCTISGDGPDLAELKHRFIGAGIHDHVRFTGWTASDEVPKLMNQHDVFLFPSNFEGYPIALIEAMAGGCAPIASRLPGITDWIIHENVNGLLFPIGDVRRAAQHLSELLFDRSRLISLRQQAERSVRGYSLEWMAERYFELFCDIRSHPAPIRPAERLESCNIAPGLKPAWWYGLPEPIKSRLRILREKIHSSVQSF